MFSMDEIERKNMIDELNNVYNNKKTEEPYKYPVYLFIKKRRNCSVAGSTNTLKINNSKKRIQTSQRNHGRNSKLQKTYKIKKPLV